MAETKTQGAGQCQVANLDQINPLIDLNGNTVHVEAVLDLLSFLVLDATNDGLALSDTQAHGMAFMLDTCRIALLHMNSEVRHG